MSRALKALALAATVTTAAALPAAANYGDRARGGEAVIFVHPEFRGAALAIDGPVYNLHELGFNDTVSSIDVSGAWEVCEHPDFRGRCAVIDGPTPHLTRLHMNDNISSMRPLDRRARRAAHRRDRDHGYGNRGHGDYRAHNQGIDGRHTVFFPRPRDAYGERVPVGRGNANQFCREMGLGRAVYADRGRRNLTDVLCAK
ncbi:MAG: beta/gamma crystallin family protein [Henriciella sp.]|nr:beta/gamma crystallin family protein [Henriciella sp.]